MMERLWPTAVPTIELHSAVDSVALRIDRVDVHVRVRRRQRDVEQVVAAADRPLDLHRRQVERCDRLVERVLDGGPQARAAAERGAAEDLLRVRRRVGAEHDDAAEVDGQARGRCLAAAARRDLRHPAVRQHGHHAVRDRAERLVDRQRATRRHVDAAGRGGRGHRVRLHRGAVDVDRDGRRARRNRQPGEAGIGAGPGPVAVVAATEDRADGDDGGSPHDHHLNKTRAGAARSRRCRARRAATHLHPRWPDRPRPKASPATM